MTRRLLTAAIAATVGTLILFPHASSAVDPDGPTFAAPSTLQVDPNATVESDSIVSDDPATPDTFSLPGTSGSTYFINSAGAKVTFATQASGTWWDGVCTDGESRYSVVKSYPRPNDHNRMEGSYAKMYCGKATRESEAPQSEAPFGIRHIRYKHKSQFNKYAAWQGSTWGNFMHWAVWHTLESPSYRTDQNDNRFCYQKIFYFKNPSGDTVERRVVVSLGRTGQRIMTSFPRTNTYCQGDSF